MELAKESTGSRRPLLVSLIINAIHGLVVYGMISFIALQYFDNFWTNWVLFVSGLIIAYMIWRRIDPIKDSWSLNGWITRSVGVAIYLVLALTIGF